MLQMTISYLAITFGIHLAWQIRVTAKMLNLFLTLKMVMFLTGVDPKTDPYSYVVIQNTKENVTDLIDEKQCRHEGCHCSLAKAHQLIITIRVSQVFL